MSTSFATPWTATLYAEYIMRNAELDKAQAGITNTRRNINNLSYADDTTLIRESEEDLKSLLMKVKEDSEIWLKTQNSRNENHGIWFHLVPWQTMGKQW